MGEWATGSGSLRDASRRREIAFRLYYPKEGGRWPLVVFSHGAGGSSDGYRYIGTHLASRGYACLHPNHPGTDASLLQARRFSLNQEAIRRAALEPANRRARPADVLFVLDHWAEIEEGNPAIRGRADLQRIAAAGHSLGALTAVDLAGSRDARFKAFIAISPPTPTQYLDESVWDSISGPLLCITGSRDVGLLGETPERRRQSFHRLPPGRKYLMEIEGATHLSFTDPMPFNDRPAVREAVRQAAAAFLDARLRDDPAAFEKMLREDAERVRWTCR